MSQKTLATLGRLLSLDILSLEWSSLALTLHGKIYQMAYFHGIGLPPLLGLLPRTPQAFKARIPQRQTSNSPGILKFLTASWTKLALVVCNHHSHRTQSGSLLNSF